MIDTQYLTVLGFGFLLGLRHALDADHIAAVSTLMTRRPAFKVSGILGACWGLGHTTMLMLVGLVVISLQIHIPQEWSEGMEMVVGIMLVVLGSSLAWTLYRERWHIHIHQHGQQSHFHFHSHRFEEDHAHQHWYRISLPPFFVGMAHGLAGSAALTLLVISTTQTIWEAMIYIFIFGVGSILGMLLLGLVITVPLVWAGEGGRRALPILQGVASLCSIAVGLSMILQFVW